MIEFYFTVAVLTFFCAMWFAYSEKKWNLSKFDLAFAFVCAILWPMSLLPILVGLWFGK